MSEILHVGMLAFRTRVKAPTITSVTATSTSQLDPIWAVPVGFSIALTELEFSADGSTGWTQVYSGAALTAPHTGRAANTDYYYRARVQDAQGNYSPYSAIVSKRTLPAPPAGLSASGINAAQLRIACSSPGSGISNFRLYVATTQNGGYVAAPDTITAFPYDYTVGTASTQRFLRVSAINDLGVESAPSAIFSGTTQAAASGNLAFFDNFDTTPIGQDADSTKWATSIDRATPAEASQVIVGTFAMQGTRSIYRAMTWSSNTIGGEHTHRIEHASRWRCELLDEVWYGVSFKPDTMPVDPMECIIFQMHDESVSGSIIRQVPFAFLVDNDLYKFWIIHCEDIFGADASPNRRTTNYAQGLNDSTTSPSGGLVNPAFWTVNHTTGDRFVVHIKWDHRGATFPGASSTGLVEIWKNGILYFRKAGPVGYGHPEGTGPNFKNGFYKALQRLNDPGVGRRTVSGWWDDIRIFVGADGYQEVA